MDGILLQRSEFMVLLDAVQASGVVGLPRETFPTQAEQFRALVLDGINRLQMRGLLRKQASVNVLNSDLLAMAAAVAHPQLAVLTTHEAAGAAAPEVFMHYETAGLVVEQTFPAEQEHRLVALSNRGMLIDRLNAIFALPEKNGSADRATVVPHAALTEAKARAEGGQAEAAVKVLAEAAVDAETAKALVECFQAPVASTAVVLMQCRDGQVTASRNAALVEGPSTAWVIVPAEPESVGYVVATAHPALLARLLRKWMLELAPPAPRVLG